MWPIPNWETNSIVSQDDATSLYHKKFRTHSHGSYGANAGGKLRGKRYAFFFVDDFSKYSWVNFLREKSDTFDVSPFIKLVLEKNLHLKKVVRIRSDHGREFENSLFVEFCNKHCIRHEFSAPKTP